MAVYTVSQVSEYLADVLRRDVVLQDLLVQGEVSNLSQPGSGHSYFSLRDSDATLRCAMFRGASGAKLLSSGLAIVAHGRASMYARRGDLQLIVDAVQLYGVGDLQLKLEQLKIKLENEGLFEEGRKRPIPEYPRKVGVVTSPTGAVWQDIQTVIRRRYPLVDLLLAPTQVQGDGTVGGLVEAFDALNEIEDVDVIIVARGGGSLEDLWPFNDESVARAVYRSHIPVISAIGHETDITIVDWVADLRAPTPSAAAELAVPDMQELSDNLMASRHALTLDVVSIFRARQDALLQLEHRLSRGFPNLDTLRLRIDDMLRSAMSYLRRDVALNYERASGLRMRLDTLSPTDTLRRGYAIVQSDGLGVVTDSEQVVEGDEVKVTLSYGGFEAEVTRTHSDV